MGMAASQARYLALVARKSNCEYEGQQINQARTVLSNQSANLFNQMLGLNVPVPPSTQDFTKQQYSYTDGINESTIDSWQQLSDSDPEYNYVVTHHYYTEKYTGSQKKLSDPQVQFNSGGTTATGKEIKDALDKINTEYAEYEEAKKATEDAMANIANIKSYQNVTKYDKLSLDKYDDVTDTYTLTDASGTNKPEFVGYSKLTPDQQEAVKAEIDKLIEVGALSEADIGGDSYSEVYCCITPAAGETPAVYDIAFKKDLDQLNGGAAGGKQTSLPTYSNIVETATALQNAVTTAKSDELDALTEYNSAVTEYNSMDYPTYIGNSELTPISEPSKDQLAEINQIIEDMREQGIQDTISKCFDANGNYTGGIYTFKMNGITYFTTLEDLTMSYNSGTGNNHIDGQTKLAYYNATYVNTKIEETEKALVATDGNGRFTSVRFESDSVTYALNMETITDDVAYQDAMNQYYYDNAVYDKAVQDINAKTSLIHQQDQQLELRLKQLDTEQSALSTEMEAVKKVVDDNVESSFKTFNS